MTEEEVALVSGHSTRSGYANTAITSGKSILEVMQKLRHSDPKTVMAYMRENDLVENVLDDAMAGRRPGRKRTDAVREDGGQR